MFSRSTIDLTQAGSAGSLVSDYLAGKKELREFYVQPPTPEGFAAFLKDPPYKGFARQVTAEALRVQAMRMANTSRKSLDNIKLLGQEKSFAVTTGHQLCLFTGPLYFIYKIATTINLAKKLSEQFSDLHFVPVYWMASEDHDFAEINHLQTFDSKVVWESAQTGAVGRFKTEELKKVLPAIEETFGNSEKGNELTDLFRKSYLEHKNLADATRFLVNALFGDEGVVIADGDDPLLKKQFTEDFLKDIEGMTGREMTETISHLTSLKYPAQVHQREVNLFLLTQNNRLRIDRVSDGDFSTGEERLSPQQLRDLAIRHPEQLSPNVSLRALYQQKVLPNIAYVGGPGELSYWLEFRRTFDAYGITFPILVPRNSFTLIDQQGVGKLKRLGLQTEQLFQPVEELVRNFQSDRGLVADFEKEKKEISDIFNTLNNKASAIDSTLKAHVDALKTRHLKSIDALKAKADRAFRRKSETDLNRVKAARDLIFPGGVPQERILNFSVPYLLYGASWIKSILEQADPFLRRHVILSDTAVTVK